MKLQTVITLLLLSFMISSIMARSETFEDYVKALKADANPNNPPNTFGDKNGFGACSTSKPSGYYALKCDSPYKATECPAHMTLTDCTKAANKAWCKLNSFENHEVVCKENFESSNCDEPCGEDPTQCGSCASDSGYILTEAGNCIKPSLSVSQCKKFDGKVCTQCAEGYGLYNGRCIQCGAPTSKIASCTFDEKLKFTITECKFGSNKGTRSGETEEKCHSCGGNVETCTFAATGSHTTLTCVDGFYKDGTNCLGCPSNSICNAKDTILFCKFNYKLSTESGKKACLKNFQFCKEYDGIDCKTCHTGYVLKLGQKSAGYITGQAAFEYKFCEEDTNCSVYDVSTAGNYSKCTTCKAPKKPLGTTNDCDDCTITVANRNDGDCECKIGWSLNAEKTDCVQCPQTIFGKLPTDPFTDANSCTSCIDDVNKCSSCDSTNPNVKLDKTDGKCKYGKLIDKCDKFDFKTQKCTKCMAGTFNFQGIECRLCDEFFPCSPCGIYDSANILSFGAAALAVLFALFF